MAWINVNGLAPALLKPFAVFGILVLSLFIFRETALTQPDQVSPEPSYPVLSDEQVAWIGSRIFANECNRQLACLTSWNAGEEFPSLGIGHFIWYQQGQDGIFEESFPALMQYLQENGVNLPGWIVAGDFDSPWQNRDAFLNDIDGDRLQELRDLLAQTMDLQTAFIISRFESALDAILASTDQPAQVARIRNNFYRVAASNTPYGLYALIDYVNFKGTGISDRETYNGEGWGLKQVLLGMNTGEPALPAFVAAARHALGTRVANAPVERNESRWLTGWNNRLDTYLPASLPAVLPETSAAP